MEFNNLACYVLGAPDIGCVIPSDWCVEVLLNIIQNRTHPFMNTRMTIDKRIFAPHFFTVMNLYGYLYNTLRVLLKSVLN